MDGYKISEAARATGFNVSALRFYEHEGVVIPQRTATGYRTYAEDHLEQLRFVARGKQLGLSLDEITELLALLDEDKCEPVQTRISQLIAKRISQAQERIAQLMGFTAQLQDVASRLGGHTPEGACDDNCGCRSDPDPVETNRTESIILVDASAPQVACSLEPDRMRARIQAWRTIVAPATHSDPMPQGIRLHLPPGTDVAALSRLAADEQTCCGFFTFRIGIHPDEITLEVTGPPDAWPVITAMFGTGREPSVQA